MQFEPITALYVSKSRQYNHSSKTDAVDPDRTIKQHSTHCAEGILCLDV